MSILDALASAWEAVRGNLLRTILTMLGIIIGVAAVILVVSIGSGARETVINQIRSLGSNLIIIDARGSLWLSEKDAEAIEAAVPSASFAVAFTRGGAPVDRGNIHWSTSLNGVTMGFLEARDWALSVGRDFSQDEYTSGGKVVLLGATVARLLFGMANPVGSVIRLKDVPFTVIGILSPKGQSNTGRDQDDIAIVPLKTATLRLFGANPVNPDRVDTILVKVKDGWDLAQVQKEIRTLLAKRPKLQTALADEIQIKNVDDILKVKEQSASSLALLVGIIASISLVVGGIGIMNIMLVSVVERTREIGVRMAVGARRRDILLQFLVESSTLSSIGGIIGILLGLGSAAIAARFTEWPFIPSLSAILLAVLSGSTVGIVFGFYPARRASLLDPIEALRHE